MDPNYPTNPPQQPQQPIPQPMVPPLPPQNQFPANPTPTPTPEQPYVQPNPPLQQQPTYAQPQQPVPQATPNMVDYQQPTYAQPPVNPQSQLAYDQSNYYANGEKPSLLLGVLSIVFSWIPLAGWILGSIAISKGSKNNTLRVLGIIGVFISTLVFIVTVVIQTNS